jgi:hypothetical protein
LRSGSVVHDGTASEAIELYLQDALQKSQTSNTGNSSGQFYETHSLLNVHGANSQGSPELDRDDDLIVTVKYRALAPPEEIHFNLSIWTEQGLLVTSADSRLAKGGCTKLGEAAIRCAFPSIPLSPGRYLIKAYILSEAPNPLASFGWNDGRVSTFLIKPRAETMSTSMVWYPTQADYGLCRVPFEWSLD